MHRGLTFVQIVLATLLGSLANDGLQKLAKQCVARDTNGCAETRIQCIWNSLKTPSIIHFCVIETKV